MPPNDRPHVRQTMRGIESTDQLSDHTRQWPRGGGTDMPRPSLRLRVHTDLPPRSVRRRSPSTSPHRLVIASDYAPVVKTSPAIQMAASEAPRFARSTSTQTLNQLGTRSDRPGMARSQSTFFNASSFTPEQKPTTLKATQRPKVEQTAKVRSRLSGGHVTAAPLRAKSNGADVRHRAGVASSDGSEVSSASANKAVPTIRVRPRDASSPPVRAAPAVVQPAQPPQNGTASPPRRALPRMPSSQSIASDSSAPHTSIASDVVAAARHNGARSVGQPLNSPAKEFPGAVQAISASSPISSPIKTRPAFLHTQSTPLPASSAVFDTPPISATISTQPPAPTLVLATTQHESSAVATHTQTQSQTQTQAGDDAETSNAHAHAQRKLGDLEIRNASLLAVNAQLERRTRRWAREVRDLRALLDSGARSAGANDAGGGALARARASSLLDDGDGELEHDADALGEGDILPEDLLGLDDDLSPSSQSPGAGVGRDRVARLKAIELQQLTRAASDLKASLERSILISDALLRDARRGLSWTAVRQVEDAQGLRDGVRKVVVRNDASRGSAAGKRASTAGSSYSDGRPTSSAGLDSIGALRHSTRSESANAHDGAYGAGSVSGAGTHDDSGEADEQDDDDDDTAGEIDQTTMLSDINDVLADASATSIDL